MRYRYLFGAVILAAVVYLTVDFISLTNAWRFYGWEMFTRGDTDVLPESVKLGNTVPGVQVPPSGEGILPDTPYHFTAGWHLLHMRQWESHLQDYIGKPGVHALEIGSYEGLSAIWQLEHVLTDPNSTITCIDIFDRPEIEARFDRNIAASGLAHKVIKIKGPSEKELRPLDFSAYDYVYIDGCHLERWVLSDAVLSWDLIKPGGLMLFDDYRHIDERPSDYRPTHIKFVDDYFWNRKARHTYSPARAIDAFIDIYGPWLDVVFKQYQIVLRKKSGEI